MSVELERRVQKLEVAHDDLKSSINNLNTTLALLNQTVSTMYKNEDKKKAILDKIYLFVFGAFAAAAITWVIGGGFTR